MSEQTEHDQVILKFNYFSNLRKQLHAMQFPTRCSNKYAYPIQECANASHRHRYATNLIMHSIQSLSTEDTLQNPSAHTLYSLHNLFLTNTTPHSLLISDSCS